jgi:DNA polymerase
MKLIWTFYIGQFTMKLRIDFETYSDIDIKVQGSYIYATHPSTRILMMGYKEHGKEAKLWLPGQDIPEEVLRADRFYAHNAVFEYLIFKHCGAAVGLPQLELNQFIDVMALCGKYAYPLSLAKAAKALGVEEKDTAGTRLIKLFCTPQGGGTPHTHPTDWEDFKAYCKQDVDTMAEVVVALPHHELSQREQKLWELTQEINFRGVPVNADEARAVYRYVEMYKEAHAERLPDLTGGNVTKATQVQRIKRWCESEGYPMPDGLGAQLIEEALDGPNPPPDHVAEVLEIRKEMGSSSANKFKLAQDYEQDGRVHMSFVKNGATTGRYASWNFQMHNLAKLKPLEDPNVLFKKFMDIEEIDSPFRAAKSLVRALIKAPKRS